MMDEIDALVHRQQLYASIQREQKLRRDLEVCRKEKAALHARVTHQRRELAALSRAQWEVRLLASLRGRALSFLAPFVKVMGEVSATELLRTAELGGGWPSTLAVWELERRKHWHFVGSGLKLTELPSSPHDAPTLDQTG